MADSLDYEKKELSIGIDNFNKPAQLSGKDAWINLITTLLFMKKGTYPTDPEMGCELQKYDYGFMESTVFDKIENEIRDQITTYLPDIPLNSIRVTSESSNGRQPVLLIILEFDVDDITDFQTAVVAAEKLGQAVNFAVSM